MGTESHDALRLRKLDEAAALRHAKAALWTRAETRSDIRDLAAAVCDGGVVRCVTGAASGQIPSSQALAVVTDIAAGGTGLASLTAWRERSNVPVMWWDHVVDPVQIADARVAGADAVRITLTLVDDEALDDCLTAAERAGIVAVVVVESMADAVRALNMGAEAVAGTGLDPERCRSLGAVLVFDIVRNGVAATPGVDAIIAGSTE